MFKCKVDEKYLASPNIFGYKVDIVTSVYGDGYLLLKNCYSYQDYQPADVAQIISSHNNSIVQTKRSSGWNFDSCIIRSKYTFTLKTNILLLYGNLKIKDQIKIVFQIFCKKPVDITCNCGIISIVRQHKEIANVYVRKR